MQASVELNEFEQMVNRLNRVASELREIQDIGNYIIMLDIDEVTELTKWNRQTVCKIFNRPDFPAQCFGKSKLVEISALRDYFKIRHERS